MRPVVAISCDRTEVVPAPGPNAQGRIRPVPARVIVAEAVVQRLREAGLEAILLPPAPENAAEMVAWTLEHCASVVITGGHFDIHPSHYDQEVHGRLDRVDEGRTVLELLLAQAADFQLLIDASLVKLGRRTFAVSHAAVHHSTDLEILGVHPEKVRLSVREVP